jgi:hypothetical protein
MICPKCNKNDAHRSHRLGFKDRFYRLFELIPYRCRSCSARFYAYRAGEGSDKLRTPEERKIIELRRKIKWKNSRKQILAYAIAGILLLGILYEMLQQTVRSE